MGRTICCTVSLNTKAFAYSHKATFRISYSILSKVLPVATCVCLACRGGCYREDKRVRRNIPFRWFLSTTDCSGDCLNALLPRDVIAVLRDEFSRDSIARCSIKDVENTLYTIFNSIRRSRSVIPLFCSKVAHSGLHPAWV